MPALSHLVTGAKGGEAAGVEIVGARAGAGVPGLARVILLEAGPRVKQHQRARALGVAGVKGERHVAAEREAADDGSLLATGVEDRGDVGDGKRFRVSGALFRVSTLSVAAHIPYHDLVAGLEGRDLTVPHAAGGAVAVREQNGRAVPVHFVVDGDAIAVERRHAGLPFLSSLLSSVACSTQARRQP